MVLARKRYEAWLVAGLDLGEASPAETDELPNPDRLLERHFGRYKKTVDQPSLTARLGIPRARARSASFDKLMRTLIEIETKALRSED